MSFDFTVETSRGMNEVIEQLESALKEVQFGVLWDFDLTEKLQEKGMDFATPYRILEVCNPKEAQHVLSVNKTAGYFLPCKLVVFEDNGKTKVGMPKPTSLIGLADSPELFSIAEDIEKRLISAIDKAIDGK
ncbi:hypothetical protein Q73_01450 [Bacillus coahuilensis m2-6]|uniref:DUF302 domain-containing protein n=1 Tax=Bacillus coahuilensis TaxID=408580 RepID=UPI00018512D7|nr:DUF302 domain-containing protein [Bacillus coahuilensis]KUP09752.1 hypothetical protein Q73_01450 [Bacillus coahuilensis m2-6]